mmetsp:Transcript_52531/g.159649  ORF Transcript_52531/g.159649 Transcript_52531/m.159649 type:complete len:308 (+) Transcript_52531:489-1412(+)
MQGRTIATRAPWCRSRTAFLAWSSCARSIFPPTTRPALVKTRTMATSASCPARRGKASSPRPPCSSAGGASWAPCRRARRGRAWWTRGPRARVWTAPTATARSRARRATPFAPPGTRARARRSVAGTTAFSQVRPPCAPWPCARSPRSSARSPTRATTRTTPRAARRPARQASRARRRSSCARSTRPSSTGGSPSTGRRPYARASIAPSTCPGAMAWTRRAARESPRRRPAPWRARAATSPWTTQAPRCPAPRTARSATPPTPAGAGRARFRRPCRPRSSITGAMTWLWGRDASWTAPRATTGQGRS